MWTSYTLQTQAQNLKKDVILQFYYILFTYLFELSLATSIVQLSFFLSRSTRLGTRRVNATERTRVMERKRLEDALNSLSSTDFQFNVGSSVIWFNVWCSCGDKSANDAMQFASWSPTDH